MFDSIAPRYDLVNRLMTFGLDIRWRRQSARALGLPSGSVVLDLACGTGDFLVILEEAGLQPFGMDLSWGMLVANHTGRPLAQADASRLPLDPASVDGITCGYALRNFTDLQGPSTISAGWSGRVDGSVSSRWRSRPVPCSVWGTGSGSGRWCPCSAGCSPTGTPRYLPRSTAYLPEPDELRDMLRSAGFSAVNRRALSGGLSQLLTATREGRP